MVDQEAWELADHVHDVGGDECLRVLGLTLLAKIEELFDHSTEELVLLFDGHATGDGTEGPAEFVKTVEVDVVVAACLLHELESFVHDLDHLVSVAVSEEDQCLSHHFIEGDILGVDLVLLFHLAVVVNGEKDFVWFRHEVEHNVLDFRKDLGVDVGVHQGRGLGLLDWKVEPRDLLACKVHTVLPLLVHDVLGEEVPVVKADFEELFVLNSAHLGKVDEPLEGLVPQHLHFVV